MSRLLIPRDFNLVINGNQNLYGQLSTVTPGGIEVERKDYRAGGAMLDRQPITGFKFKPFKFKVAAYPDGFDALPIGEQLILSFTEYLVDENDGSEHGLRHVYHGELDLPGESDRKPGDLPEWDYEVKNTRLYQKFKNDKLIDEGSLKTNSLMLNGNRLWAKRRSYLQLG
ncbi:phage major tail tube protein [Polycladidibacter stylochi]|uniref:phage major tail tube protein n=1 Tax=Polycladidibacter stylochi TaxID=1807766 RepID=UPI0008305493|nr:phage major tail tube protein [Pseudovibrio stylochi]